MNLKEKLKEAWHPEFRREREIRTHVTRERNKLANELFDEQEARSRAEWRADLYELWAVILLMMLLWNTVGGQS